jgi:hypothetical protein
VTTFGTFRAGYGKTPRRIKLWESTQEPITIETLEKVADMIRQAESFPFFLERALGRPLRYSERSVADAVDRSRAMARGLSIGHRSHPAPKLLDHQRMALNLWAERNAGVPYLHGNGATMMIVDDPFRFLGTGHLPMTLAAAHDVIDEQGPICKTSP